MLFYEMDYQIDKPLYTEEKKDVRAEKRRLVNIINRQEHTVSKTMRFDIVETNDYNIFITVFISDENKDDEREKVKEFLASLGVSGVRLLSLREITIRSYIENIETANSNGFVDNPRLLLSKVDENIRGYQYDTSFKEQIVSETLTREEALERARKLCCIPDLEDEIERIFKGAASLSPFAHPVQYVVFCDSENARRKVRELLVASLYSVGRLRSRRICFVGSDSLDDEDCDSFDGEEEASLYDVQRGSTLIFRAPYISYSDGMRKDRDDGVREVCKSILKYHQNTLTIIELKKKSVETFENIKEALPGIRFVVLKERMIDAKKAKRTLKSRASSDGIKECKALLSLVDEKTDYYYDDLDKLYSTWFDTRLCQEVYPQYKDLVAGKSALPRKVKGSAYGDLEKLIGLESAKKVIRSAIDYNKARKIFSDNGIEDETMCRHMVFTGNPGSAKTTVARLFAQIMKDNGILPCGNLIEVGRADIVDRYVGGTAPRVKNLFERAQGNVLFIDEAYSLYDGDRGLYGDEAVNTIVQEMENHRSDTVVIFAGYKDKMETFLNSNPGLKSRIAFHVNFDDYSEDELWRILNLFVEKGGMTMERDVEEKVRPIFREASTHQNFGNGRFVRNLYEKARRNQASRVVNMDEDHRDRKALTLLISDDFEALGDYTEKDRIIGFAS